MTTVEYVTKWVTCCAARHVQPYITCIVSIRLWKTCRTKTGSAQFAQPRNAKVSMIASATQNVQDFFVAKYATLSLSTDEILDSFFFYRIVWDSIDTDANIGL